MTPSELAAEMSALLPRMAGVKQLTAIDLAVMLYLAESPATLGSLVIDLQQPTAVMSDRVDDLVAAGRVSRKRNQFDHRQYVLALTPKGQRLLRTATRYREVTT